MTIDGLPVSGPGSQPMEDGDAGLDFISLPKEMNGYRAPDIPEPEKVQHLEGARAAVNWIRQALECYRVGGEPQIADISALDIDSRKLINQILGEGEVSLRFSGPVQVVMQESVLAGIWRTFYLDANHAVTRDLIEICDVPVLARCRPDASRAADLTAVPAPGDVMNAMSILSEIKDHMRSWRTGCSLAHVINLTLLPLSEGDVSFLDETLGSGPVETLSRGYGDCKISATAYPGVWWVRYTNSMGTLILNTLEITDIPAVACAAQEDLEDSRRRFRELLEPYWRELA